MDENIKIGQDVPLPKSKIQSLHTYESDIARAVRDNDGSVTKIAIAEQKRKEANINQSSKIITRKKNFSYLIMGLILIVVVFMSTRFVVNLIKEKSVYKGSTEKIATFFTIEKQTLIDSSSLVGKELIAMTIKNALKVESISAGMNAIFIKKSSIDNNLLSIISTQEFISIMQFNMPGGLARSLDEQMLVAGYKNNIEKKPHLFFLWNTNNYDQAFAGMLEWETVILGDMFTLFDIDITNKNSYLLNKKWEDILIDNNDARILKYEDGTPLLYYMFLDNNIFIITDDIETIREVIKRLRAQKLKN